MAIQYEDDRVRIQKVVASPYDNNAYIVNCKATNELIIIDSPRWINKVLAETSIDHLKATLITHGHFDHIEGSTNLRGYTNAPFGIHPDDATHLPWPPDFLLIDRTLFELGHLSLKVLHTPGHTPGGICLLLGKHLFSGDTLFPGGPGRTSSPDSFREIIRNIETKLITLPDDTIVYPGHGDNTTISIAKKEFAIFMSKVHRDTLCGNVRWLDQ